MLGYTREATKKHLLFIINLPWWKFYGIACVLSGGISALGKLQYIHVCDNKAKAEHSTQKLITNTKRAVGMDAGVCVCARVNVEERRNANFFNYIFAI